MRRYDRLRLVDLLGGDHEHLFDVDDGLVGLEGLLVDLEAVTRVYENGASILLL